MPQLRVIGGPDVGTSAVVNDAPVTIGRGSQCGLKITDKHASMVHAVVEPFEQGCRVRDLESSGGTAVNGKQVLEYRLMFGDIITVGETTILFGSGSETADRQTVGSAESPMPGDSGIA